MNMKVQTSPVDNLVAGTFKQLTKTLTLKSGKVYKRGEILELDADNKAISLATEAKAQFVLVNDTDATAGDVDSLAFTTGQFHLDECTFNQSLDSKLIIDTLHKLSIFLK